MQLTVAILMSCALPTLGNHTSVLNETRRVQQMAPKPPRTASTVAPKGLQYVQAPGMPIITIQEVMHPHGASDLPELSTVLGGALDEVKNVASQAAVLQGRIEQLEKQSEDKVANEKSLFEDRLELQQNTNKDLFWTNGNLSNDIQNLTLENNALQKRIRDVQASNKEIRTEIQAISSKLSEAKDFANALLKSTESESETTTITTTTTRVPHARILRQHALIASRVEPGRRKLPMKSILSARSQARALGIRQRPTNNIFLQENSVSQINSLDMYADGQTDQMYQPAGDEPTSPPVPPVDPREVIANLSRGLERIKTKAKQGEDKLSQTFLAAYRAGNSVHQSLVAQERALEEARTSLTEQQRHLRAQEDDEEANHDHMQQELVVSVVSYSRLQTLF